MYLIFLLSIIFNIIFIICMLKQRSVIEDLIYNLRVKENTIDIARMQKALNSETFTMPPDLTREQKRQHIINSAKNNY